jgi:hypothetical protein
MKKQAENGKGNELVIEVGNIAFEPGLTQVKVDENGQVLITNQYEKETRTQKARIEPESASKLIDQTLSPQMQMSELIGKKFGLPDEPRYHFETYQDGQLVATHDIWRSDLAHYPELSQMVKDLQDMVYKSSDGTIIF